MPVDQLQTVTTAKGILEGYLQANLETLLGTLRVYVQRAGLASGTGIQDAAADLLGRTVAVALQNTHKFNTEMPPRSWLLGIAANLIKEEQRKTFTRTRREMPLETAETGRADAGGWWETLSTPGPDTAILAQANVEQMLAWLSPDDREIVTLYVVNELDYAAVAQALQITPGAARTRLCRALQRLRDAHVRNARPDAQEGQNQDSRKYGSQKL